MRISNIEIWGKHISKLPAEVLSAALEANPWFTSFYIENSLKGILTWLKTETLEDFLQSSQLPISASPLKVNIISAANLPLVGFHDILITLLSGNIAQIRASRRDSVLIKWMVEQWHILFPAESWRLQMSYTQQKSDVILATGSNNSARYFRRMASDTTLCIRQSRTSVAIIEDWETNSRQKGLADDIFLYNGLGCRNVTNILLPQSLDAERVLLALKKYNPSLLSPLYLKKVKQQRALFQSTSQEFFDGNIILGLKKDKISVAAMGVIHLIHYANKIELDRMLEQSESDIQCVVGRDVFWGESQFPKLSDFADGINSFAFLTQQNRN